MLHPEAPRRPADARAVALQELPAAVAAGGLVEVLGLLLNRRRHHLQGRARRRGDLGHQVGRRLEGRHALPKASQADPGVLLGGRLVDLPAAAVAPHGHLHEPVEVGPAELVLGRADLVRPGEAPPGGRLVGQAQASLLGGGPRISKRSVTAQAHPTRAP